VISGMSNFTAIPKDLNMIKSRVALRMTKRQLICFGTAIVVGIPVYFLTRGAIGNSPAVLIMMGAMAPLFLLAIYEKDGLPAEVVMRNYIRAKFFWPGVRPFKTENFYEVLTEQEGINLAETTTQSNTRAEQTSASKHSNGKNEQRNQKKR